MQVQANSLPERSRDILAAPTELEPALVDLVDDLLRPFLDLDVLLLALLEDLADQAPAQAGIVRVSEVLLYSLLECLDPAPDLLSVVGSEELLECGS